MKFWKALAVFPLAVVAVATVVVPQEMVWSQDLRAVERRLGGAVEAGEISLHQANLMMETLRRSRHSDELAAKKNRYLQVTGEIKAAVDAGKLTEKEAEMELMAVRSELFQGKVQNERVTDEMLRKKHRYMRIVEEVKAAVDVGKLSAEEAEEKLIAVRREMFEPQAKKEGEAKETAERKYLFMRFKEEIKAAVDAGKISPGQAEEKLLGMRREFFESKGQQKGNERGLRKKELPK